MFQIRHQIPIGLHANLSEGAPVGQNLQQVSTLINSQGFFHGKMGFRQALERSQLSMDQVPEPIFVWSYLSKMCVWGMKQSWDELHLLLI